MKPLSHRQYQVLDRISLGDTTSQVATALFITEDTVKSHIKRVFTRLSARSRAHAVRIAMEQGILPNRPQKRARAATSKAPALNP